MGAVPHLDGTILIEGDLDGRPLVDVRSALAVPTQRARQQCGILPGDQAMLAAELSRVASPSVRSSA
ncbi:MULTISPECIES: hypothetical protein [unclassified Micromonospora]|uniref:hypothetical protein n=1 Tax=unclassified Micromonospora TaxID=2617518 RepID=UPI0033B9F311